MLEVRASKPGYVGVWRDFVVKPDVAAGIVFRSHGSGCLQGIGEGRVSVQQVTPLDVGSVLGDYRIDGVLGKGGMATVYEATELSLDRQVALKVISAELGEQLEFRERFRREAVQQAKLDHVHIVPVYRADEIDGRLFIAMRLIRGTSLKDLAANGDSTQSAACTFSTRPPPRSMPRTARASSIAT